MDDEFSEYVAARWPRLVRSAVLLGCDAAEAEDIAQATLARCLTRWQRVRTADDRDAYVHRILLNTFSSARRRRWTGERPVATLPERPAPDDAQDRYDRVDALQRSLARLTPDHRTCVVLRYYALLNEEQMARVLGVAPGTVKSRLARALKALAADPSLADLRGVS